MRHSANSLFGKLKEVKLNLEKEQWYVPKKNFGGRLKVIRYQGHTLQKIHPSLGHYLCEGAKPYLLACCEPTPPGELFWN